MGNFSKLTKQKTRAKQREYVRIADQLTANKMDSTFKGFNDQKRVSIETINKDKWVFAVVKNSFLTLCKRRNKINVLKRWSASDSKW